ncbi:MULTISPECIES: hypothetical protein [Pseudomonas]|uniref:Uncharacterized protein n=1 Tax=Pseudomonas wuhanensis TaxID=2954098 RepID=A0ABY9GQS1_9PSED|nr:MULTISPECIES: hypothetical protein [unclassified Pseudomonas]WLI11674.1 hypothetical protein PSH65_26615 [Pseudomonas sp. FP603]WLI17515.1 hypothetical protein PSH88_25250 [Pseudomonas sp. FP607]
MSKNSKKSSPRVSSLASKVLRDKESSAIAKSLAASVISQAGSDKQSGAKMETKASQALQDKRLSKTTRTLAASVVSQSSNER